MNHDIEFDPTLAALFASAPAGVAPRRVLAGALEQVATTPQQLSPAIRLGRAWPGARHRRRSLIVALVILTILAGVIATGALRHERPPVITSESMVVVRQDTLKSGSVISVTAVDPTGSAQTLALIDPARLGGRWDGTTASVSPEGYLALGLDVGASQSQTAIIDLRDPSAPARYPDWFGDGAWGPDGRWVAGDLASTLLTFDVANGAQTFTDTRAAGASAMDYAAGAQAVDGSGSYVTDASGRIGILASDGTFTPGSRAVVDDGLWSRRVGPDGAYLRCVPTPDDPTSCMSPLTLVALRQPAVGSAIQTVVWVDDQPARAVLDYAWAVDGGIWLLVASPAGSPPGADLVNVDTTGTERRVASLRNAVVASGSGEVPPAGASLAPVVSFAGATFHAIAPDDRYLVVDTWLPPDGQGGPTYVVDTTTGAVQHVSGTIAGWLLPDTLTQPSAGANPPISTVPAELRGDWAASDQASSRIGVVTSISIGHASARITEGSLTTTFLDLAAVEGDRIKVQQPVDAFGCGVATSATYGWATTANGIRLSAVDEPCEGRAAILEGSFERSLPYSGNYQADLPAHTRYLVPEMRIRLTSPPAEAAVWKHAGSGVALAHGEGDGDVWALDRLDGQSDVVCGAAHISPGLQSVLAYLDALAPRGIEFVDRVEGTVAGQRAVTGMIKRTADSRLGGPSGGFCQAWPTRAGGFGVKDGDLLTVLESSDGRVYSLFQRGDRGWTQPITDSLEFQDQ